MLRPQGLTCGTGPFYNGAKVSDKRKSTRHVVDIPATIEVDGTTQEIRMMNLSLGGALLDMSQRLEMGSRMQVTFRIPTHEHDITVGAAVRWAGGSGIGVQFDGLRAKEVWSLNKFFESLPEAD